MFTWKNDVCFAERKLQTSVNTLLQLLFQSLVSVLGLFSPPSPSVYLWWITKEGKGTNNTSEVSVQQVNTSSAFIQQQTTANTDVSPLTAFSFLSLTPLCLLKLKIYWQTFTVCVETNFSLFMHSAQMKNITFSFLFVDHIIHPSIIFLLSEVGSEPTGPDIPLQLLLGGSEAFPGQMGYIIPPVSSGSDPGPPPKRHPDQRNHLSWLLSMWRSSGSTPSPARMVELLPPDGGAPPPGWWSSSLWMVELLPLDGGAPPSGWWSSSPHL